jgi:PGDYG protein
MSGLDLRDDRDARRARKRSLPVRVEFAAESGTLQTREGPVSYARGDALLTGSEGERWPVPRASFDASYEPVAPSRHGTPGSYRKRPLILWAKPMAEPFVVTLDNDRGTLRGKPGDWLVQYGSDDLSVVSGSLFGDIYELLD